MSTRLVRKKNIVILGMAKNGSQALKQLAFNNDDWEVVECPPHYTKESCPEGLELQKNMWLNKDVTLYIPIRDEWEREISWLVEWIRGEWVKTGKHFSEHHIEELGSFVEDKFHRKEGSEQFLPILDNSYKNKEEISYFFKNIFLNKEWNGCTVKFFDLKYLSNKFCEFINEDTSNIPVYNALVHNSVKIKIKENMPEDVNLMRIFYKDEWKNTYNNLEKPLWDRMRDTKYWLHL